MLIFTLYSAVWGCIADSASTAVGSTELAKIAMVKLRIAAKAVSNRIFMKSLFSNAFPIVSLMT